MFEIEIEFPIESVLFLFLVHFQIRKSSLPCHAELLFSLSPSLSLVASWCDDVRYGGRQDKRG